MRVETILNERTSHGRVKGVTTLQNLVSYLNKCWVGPSFKPVDVLFATLISCDTQKNIFFQSILIFQCGGSCYLGVEIPRHWIFFCRQGTNRVHITERLENKSNKRAWDCIWIGSVFQRFVIDLEISGHSLSQSETSILN